MHLPFEETGLVGEVSFHLPWVTLRRTNRHDQHSRTAIQGPSNAATHVCARHYGVLNMPPLLCVLIGLMRNTRIRCHDLHTNSSHTIPPSHVGALLVYGILLCWLLASSALATNKMAFIPAVIDIVTPMKQKERATANHDPCLACTARGESHPAARVSDSVSH